MCLLLHRSSLSAGTQDVKSRKMPETLLGGPPCLESGPKNVDIMCGRSRNQNQDKWKEAKQAVWNNWKNIGFKINRQT